MADGRVTGVGGVFIRALDHERLRAWYASRLDIEFDSHGALSLSTQEAGAPPETVFAIFNKDSDYLADARERFMLNFCVTGLDAMVARLRDLGETVADIVAEPPYGRFAWLTDPEGTRIELWEPERSR